MRAKIQIQVLTPATGKQLIDLVCEKLTKWSLTERIWFKKCSFVFHVLWNFCNPTESINWHPSKSCLLSIKCKKWICNESFSVACCIALRLGICDTLFTAALCTILTDSRHMSRHILINNAKAKRCQPKPQSNSISE